MPARFRGEGVQKSGIDAFRQMGLGEQFDHLPHTEMYFFEIYSRGRLVVRADAERLGRGQIRAVSQPALLQLLADEAGRHSSFRIERGVTMRDFLREDGRVVGVRATAADGPRMYRADLVIGADGRHAATRKHSGLAELSVPQGYDIAWLKAPYPDGYPGRTTGIVALAAGSVAVAYPAADEQLQVGFIIPKGLFTALRGHDANEHIDELVGRLPAWLADHLRAHREAFAGAALLNVVCGRLTEWTAPGLLLIGDAAHPMSPVGGQGINIATARRPRCGKPPRPGTLRRRQRVGRRRCRATGPRRKVAGDRDRPKNPESRVAGAQSAGPLDQPPRLAVHCGKLMRDRLESEVSDYQGFRLLTVASTGLTCQS